MSKLDERPCGQPALVSDEAPAGLRPSGFDRAQWQPIETAPRDGTLIDVLFDPNTAEIDHGGRRPLSMAEFYAPGSTRRTRPSSPIIERVEFSNRHFRPVSEDGSRFHACDMAVTLTHWRKHFGEAV